VQLIQTKLHPKGEGMTNLSKLLSENDLADYLKVSVYKLRRDRVENRGIPYVKYGRTVRYPLDNIVQFQQQNTVIQSLEK
jgi:hypothetical protein